MKPHHPRAHHAGTGERATVPGPATRPAQEATRARDHRARAGGTTRRTQPAGSRRGVIDVGGPATLSKSLRAVRPGGQIRLVGSLAGPEHMIDAGPLLASGITLHSITLGSRESFEDLNRAITASRMHPVIDRVFPFEQAREAFQHFRAPSRIGKVVIEH